MPLLNADLLHPITLPDGTVYRDTVHLKQAIDHPRIDAGEYNYFTHSGRAACSGRSSCCWTLFRASDLSIRPNASNDLSGEQAGD
ncbi:hypothetical protein M2360_001154 [Rhizobium sp. SG_E_25_P2]|uniref:hypothetical protein n=1 Tax=Rhizobium sp. SG_E_25_P2 TaxID=2879942 RepID=UPI002476DA75|nr:hypothetical protein [Rhizobium sp. SG_E_25_P2]MDH6265764.1 hypothetical protein [Rhizobium sp. SG_E_25_P2]